eukprot:1144760-Pelagomonas_calceolata.AAC.1
MAVLDVQFTKLPGWSCDASYFFIASHTAEYSMASSDQDSIGTAGGASSLIRNARAKEVERYNTDVEESASCSSRNVAAGMYNLNVGQWRMKGLAMTAYKLGSCKESSACRKGSFHSDGSLKPP